MILKIFVLCENVVTFLTQKLRVMLLNMLIILEAIIKHCIATLLTHEFLLCMMIKCTIVIIIVVDVTCWQLKMLIVDTVNA